MPLLEYEILIKGFYDKIKEKYPDLTYSDVETIIKTPFRFIKLQLERPEMPTVLIKYFGKFTVFPGKLRTLIKENDFDFKNKLISEEKHKLYKEGYEKKLKDLLEERAKLSNKRKKL